MPSIPAFGFVWKPDRQELTIIFRNADQKPLAGNAVLWDKNVKPEFHWFQDSTVQYMLFRPRIVVSHMAGSWCPSVIIQYILHPLAVSGQESRGCRDAKVNLKFHKLQLEDEITGVLLSWDLDNHLVLNVEKLKTLCWFTDIVLHLPSTKAQAFHYSNKIQSVFSSFFHSDTQKTLNEPLYDIYSCTFPIYNLNSVMMCSVTAVYMIMKIYWVLFL